MNVTVVMNKYNDSLRSLRVPQYKIDTSIAPIVFHSDSLGYIDEDSIPAGRYKLTFRGMIGPIIREDDHWVILRDGGLLPLMLFDFRIAPDSISIVNIRMWRRIRSYLVFQGEGADSQFKQTDSTTLKWIENIIPDST
jgi:hypothetical protein